MFTCDDCDKTFSTEKGRVLHTSRIHKTERSGAAVVARVSCKKCPKVFSHSASLSRHMRLHKKDAEDNLARMQSRIDSLEKEVHQKPIATTSTVFNTYNTNYHISVDSRETRDNMSEETFETMLSYRTQIVLKYIEYTHFHVHYPALQNFKIYRGPMNDIKAIRFDKGRNPLPCNCISLLHEVITNRCEDIEYRLAKLPFDKFASHDEKTDKWYDQLIVRRHMNDLKTLPALFHQTQQEAIETVMQADELLQKEIRNQQLDSLC